jgi:hypothetical protein
MNQQQLIEKIEAATNGKVEGFRIIYPYALTTHVGFNLRIIEFISSNQLLAFTDDFTFHIVDKNTIYVSFMTNLLD